MIKTLECAPLLGIIGICKIPMVVTLAHTREVLYPVNRPGNDPSSDGAAEWVNLAIYHVTPVFKKVWLRGDIDLSLTPNFDRWDERIGFVFGYDAKQNLVEKANALSERRWKPLQRPARYEVKTEERQRPENVKEQV